MVKALIYEGSSISIVLPAIELDEESAANLDVQASMRNYTTRLQRGLQEAYPGASIVLIQGDSDWPEIACDGEANPDGVIKALQKVSSRVHQSSSWLVSRTI